MIGQREQFALTAPDANFILWRLPESSPTGPEVERRLLVEDNIYIKHCEDKPMPESDRYIRKANRTQPENANVTAALARILSTEVAR